MYGGGNTFEGIRTESIGKEDPTKLLVFEARIDRGENKLNLKIGYPNVIVNNSFV
jgi:hypothetical protein